MSTNDMGGGTGGDGGPVPRKRFSVYHYAYGRCMEIIGFKWSSSPNRRAVAPPLTNDSINQSQIGVSESQHGGRVLNGSPLSLFNHVRCLFNIILLERFEILII